MHGRTPLTDWCVYVTLLRSLHLYWRAKYIRPHQHKDANPRMQGRKDGFDSLPSNYLAMSEALLPMFTQSELNVLHTLVHELRTDHNGQLYRSINKATFKSLSKKLNS